VTSWLAAGGVGNLRAKMEMRARFGLLLAAPAYQTCNDRRNPDTAIIIPIENDGVGGYADADGWWDHNTTAITSVVENKAEIRFGWLVKTSGAIGGARVGGLVEVMS
jgi:hypothetical protein